MNATDTPKREPDAILADGFSAFIEAAGTLERSYRLLQEEVARLRHQLEERTAALAATAAENTHIRIALHRIVDSLPCGVIVVDCRQHLVLINPEAQRLLHLPANRALHYDELPVGVQHILRDADQVAEDDEREFCLASSPGKRWVVVRRHKMFFPGDPAPSATASVGSATILMVRDNTAQRSAEQQRDHSRNIVALAEMAALLAHEIRNPLASLELLAGLLVSADELEPEPKQWAQHMQVGIRSLSAIVNNVLRFHSLGSVDLLPVKLAPILHGAVAFMRPLADQSQVRLVLEERIGQAEIQGDPNGLQQVLLNLIGNALRHTPDGGVITIVAELAAATLPHHVVIACRDNGSGIAREHIAHVFEPGFSTSAHSPGLGLAVCKRIVEQHHGSITVASSCGKGTAFRMEFSLL